MRPMPSSRFSLAALALLMSSACGEEAPTTEPEPACPCDVIIDKFPQTQFNAGGSAGWLVAVSWTGGERCDLGPICFEDELQPGQILTTAGGLGWTCDVDASMMYVQCCTDAPMTIDPYLGIVELAVAVDPGEGGELENCASVLNADGTAANTNPLNDTDCETVSVIGEPGEGLLCADVPAPAPVSVTVDSCVSSPAHPFYATVEWAWPADGVEIEQANVMMTPAVGSLNDDDGDGDADDNDIPEVVFVAFADGDWAGTGSLVVLNGADGTEEFVLHNVTDDNGAVHSFAASGGVAIGEITGDAFPEICATATDVAFVCVDREGNYVSHGVGHLVRRTLEEGTYFVALHARWCEDEHWPTTRAGFFDPLGFPMGQVVGTMIRRRVKANAHAQGTARLTPEERSAASIADWNAVSEVLGDKPYLLGDEPHSVDCTVYGFLIQALWAPYDTPMQRHTRADARLVAYAERFRARWWTT